MPYSLVKMLQPKPSAIHLEYRRINFLRNNFVYIHIQTDPAYKVIRLLLETIRELHRHHESKAWVCVV
jgi:hypothetical protein